MLSPGEVGLSGQPGTQHSPLVTSLFLLSLGDPTRGMKPRKLELCGARQDTGGKGPPDGQRKPTLRVLWRSPSQRDLAAPFFPDTVMSCLFHLRSEEMDVFLIL